MNSLDLNSSRSQDIPTGLPDMGSSPLKEPKKAIILSSSFRPKAAGPDSTYSEDFLKSSSLYSNHMARKEEINKHKWYESERAGRDVGIDFAYFDWILKYSHQWRAR
jgi:hypothetical protein